MNLSGFFEALIDINGGDSPVLLVLPETTYSGDSYRGVPVKIGAVAVEFARKKFVPAAQWAHGGQSGPKYDENWQKVQAAKRDELVRGLITEFTKENNL
jgi:hypothetical protein